MNHRHTFNQNQDGVVKVEVELCKKCNCGVILCGSPSPSKGCRCNLKNCHPGPCTNTFALGYGTWEKP